jgi:hypothetical protein
VIIRGRLHLPIEPCQLRTLLPSRESFRAAAGPDKDTAKIIEESLNPYLRPTYRCWWVFPFSPLAVLELVKIVPEGIMSIVVSWAIPVASWP